MIDGQTSEGVELFCGYGHSPHEQEGGIFHENFFALKGLYRQRELKGPEGAPGSLPVTCTHLTKGQAGGGKNFLI